MPPDMNMVTVIRIMIGFFQSTPFLDKKYAPRDVITIFVSSPIVRIFKVFR